MAIQYRPFDGKPVSLPWLDLLTAARRAGVQFHVSSGHRTLAKQAELYRLYRAGRGPVAAFPSDSAPHIRTGSPYHAVDIDVGTQGVIDFARRHGVTLRRTVASEYWHVDGSGFAGKFPTGPRTLKGGMRGKDVRALVGHLMWLGYLPWPVLGRPRSYFGGWVNTALKRFQADHGLPRDAVYGPKTRAALLGTVGARRRAGWKPKRQRPLLAPKAAPKPPPPAPRRISPAGLELVMSFEGFRAKPYRDPVGIWTIGYGHTGPDVHRLGTLTQREGVELLRKDMARFEAAVDRWVKVPLTGGQFSALVSFTYNVGETAFAQSTLLKLVNAHDYSGAAGQFARWVHGGGKVLPGLVRRRAAEAALFRS